MRRQPDPKIAAPAAFAAALLAYAAVALASWEGLSYDDALRYAEGAFAWADDPPYLGADHWRLRHPVILPVVVSHAAFGAHEWTTVLPAVLNGVALVALSVFAGGRLLGPRAGAALGALLAASAPISAPVLHVKATELPLLVAAVWLFLIVERRGGRLGLVLVGLIAGLAWLCRETAAFLPAALCLILLLSPGRKHRIADAALISAGFLSVIAAEMAFYAFWAGDPLYRYVIDLGHGAHMPEHSAFGILQAESIAEKIVEAFVKPLSKPGFALLAALWLFSLIWLRPRWRRLPEGPRRAIVVFSLGGAASFLFSSFILSLESPGYYPLCYYAFLTPVAVALGELARDGRRMAACGLAVGFLALNVAHADLAKNGEVAKLRGVARALPGLNEPLHAPFVDARFIAVLSRFQGRPDPDVVEAEAAEVPPGGLFFSLRGGLPDPVERLTVPYREHRLWRRVANLGGAPGEPTVTLTRRAPD